MRQIFLTGIAACIGAIAGIAFMTAWPSRSEAFATPGNIRTRQLEVVDENQRVTARIRSEKGHAVLEFLSGEHAVVQIGTEEGLGGGAQFVRLLGTGGRLVAAINALPPDGAATLYLGDERQEARIILGAFVTDIPGRVDDWGLQIRSQKPLETLLTILAKTPRDGQRPTVALSMRRSDGRVWSEY